VTRTDNNIYYAV